ncbi:uncharacterized protein RCC_12111 [Ramularia collo-cygni]|uniref:Uncharacterized protein n=1 Tax=Ramularia collo-cygni TaxID=112498 RepID=A0A2D3UN14_9PEZI|nr:uncharacterized protein RCC_12111 [Ramularia collo-cygni]CZT14518.1 uncharacterized protein RCC_12111 [Ramularia collo-cygni]
MAGYYPLAAQPTAMHQGAPLPPSRAAAFSAQALAFLPQAAPFSHQAPRAAHNNPAQQPQVSAKPSVAGSLPAQPALALPPKRTPEEAGLNATPPSPKRPSLAVPLALPSFRLALPTVPLALPAVPSPPQPRQHSPSPAAAPEPAERVRKGRAFLPANEALSLKEAITWCRGGLSDESGVTIKKMRDFLRRGRKDWTKGIWKRDCDRSRLEQKMEELYDAGEFFRVKQVEENKCFVVTHEKPVRRDSDSGSRSTASTSSPQPSPSRVHSRAASGPSNAPIPGGTTVQTAFLIPDDYAAEATKQTAFLGADDSPATGTAVSPYVIAEDNSEQPPARPNKKGKARTTAAWVQLYPELRPQYGQQPRREYSDQLPDGRINFARPASSEGAAPEEPLESPPAVPAPGKKRRARKPKAAATLQAEEPTEATGLLTPAEEPAEPLPSEQRSEQYEPSDEHPQHCEFLPNFDDEPAVEPEREVSEAAEDSGELILENPEDVLGAPANSLFGDDSSQDENESLWGEEPLQKEMVPEIESNGQEEDVEEDEHGDDDDNGDEQEEDDDDLDAQFWQALEELEEEELEEEELEEEEEVESEAE